MYNNPEFKPQIGTPMNGIKCKSIIFFMGYRFMEGWKKRPAAKVDLCINFIAPFNSCHK